MKPKKLAALLTAATVAMSLCVPVQAEESREFVQLGELECWIEDGEYYTEVDGEKYMVLVLGNDEKVTDQALIDQLNESRSANDRNTYPNGWPDKTEYDLSDDQEYSAYVNLASGDYYSPIFLMSIVGSDSTAKLTVHYDDFLWAETRYLDTTIFYRQAGEWFTDTVNFGINILIYSHSFDVGDQYTAGTIDRMALRFNSAQSSSGAFTYYLKQVT